MVNKDGFAEIRLGASGITLYGALRAASPPAMTVDLITRPTNSALVHPGIQVDCCYSLGGRLYASVAQVSSITDSAMELTLIQMPRQARRRTNNRVRCDMPVQYRIVRPDGHSGAWLECTADDISTGGIGLLIPPGAEIPARVEMRFFLPTVSDPALAADRLGSVAAAGGDPSAIRATGRVVHCRRISYGRARCGTTFSMICQGDRDKIAAFAHSLQPKAA